MLKLRLFIVLTFLIMVSFLIIVSCEYNAPIPLGVEGVYYVDRTDDVYYFGENIHEDRLLHLIGIALDTNYLSSGVSEYHINWKDVCRVDGNNIFWCGGEGYGYMGNFPYSFLLRLENPYDPTADAGKRVYFKDKIFSVSSVSTGMFDTHLGDEVYISSLSKKIRFSW